MPFSDTKKIRLKKNPLKNVICQLRFPTLLEIESENPTEFHKLIRNTFTEVEMRTETEGVPGNIERPPFAITMRKVHNFYNEDRSLSINLTKNFLAFSCSNYDVWKSFRNLLAMAYQALIEVYKPSYFTRIGLRYMNVIARSQYGFDQHTSWDKLIHAPLLGVMGDPSKGLFVDGVNSMTTMHCSNNDIKMQVQSGTYLTVQDSQEEYFVLDIDTFVSKNIQSDEVLNVLDDIHKRPRGFLKYAIKDQLYDAMGPEDYD